MSWIGLINLKNVLSAINYWLLPECILVMNLKVQKANAVSVIDSGRHIRMKKEWSF